MSDSASLGRLLLITDHGVAENAGHDLLAALETAMSTVPIAGAVVQVRAKQLPAGDLLSFTRRALQIAHAHRCWVLVNDRVDVAIAAAADGVHLPEKSLPISAVRRMAKTRDFVVGISTHSADAAGAAARDGADLILCGPIWETPSKRGLGEPLGLEELRAASRVSGQSAVYAVGGVNSDNAASCLSSGAHGVAVIRGWLEGDVAENLRSLGEAIQVAI